MLFAVPHGLRLFEKTLELLCLHKAATKHKPGTILVRECSHEYLEKSEGIPRHDQISAHFMP